jgi:hypothetical protein
VELEDSSTSREWRTGGQSFAGNQVGEMALRSEGLECDSRVVITIVAPCFRTIGMLVRILNSTG